MSGHISNMKHFFHRKQWWWHPWLSPVGVFLAICLTAGLSWLGWVAARPHWLASRITANVGQTIVLDGVSLTVTSPRILANDPPFEPQPGSVYNILTVTVHNGTALPIQLIPLLQFHLLDEAGNVYPIIALASTSAQLSGPIPPLERIREDLAFEVPAHAAGLRLWFEPGIEGQNVAIVRTPVWQ